MKRTFVVFLALMIGLLITTACGPDRNAESEGEAYIQAGDPAPAFSLPSASGETVSLSDYMGRQPVLLYFHMAVG